MSRFGRRGKITSACFRTWQHLIFHKTTLLPPLLPRVGFFSIMLSKGASLHARSQLLWCCLGKLTYTSLLMCAKEAGLWQPISEALAQLPMAALLPARPSVSSNTLGSPLPDHRLDSHGCFPTPCCLAPWRSGWSTRNPTTSSPWGKERREEASQKTDDKR